MRKMRTRFAAGPRTGAQSAQEPSGAVPRLAGVWDGSPIQP